MAGTIKYIAIWLFIFVVGSLIVSFLISPNTYDSFKEDTRDAIKSITGFFSKENWKVEPLMPNVQNQDNKISNINQQPKTEDNSVTYYKIQDNSLTNCLTEIKEKSRMAKEKSPIDLDIDVKESKKFSDTISAIEYLRDWGIMPSRVTGVNFYPDLFENNVQGMMVYIDLDKEEDRQYIIEHDNLIVLLIRFDYRTSEGSYGTLVPIFCIDGELSESSKIKF